MFFLLLFLLLLVALFGGWLAGPEADIAVLSARHEVALHEHRASGPIPDALNAMIEPMSLLTCSSTYPTVGEGDTSHVRGVRRTLGHERARRDVPQLQSRPGAHVVKHCC